MSLTVTVNPQVVLPDLTELEATAAAKLESLRAERELVEAFLQEHLGHIAATSPEERQASALVKKAARHPDAVRPDELAAARRTLRECAATTRDAVEQLIASQPKLVSGQITGKVSTLRRLGKHIEMWEGVSAAHAAVAEKLAAGEVASLFNMVPRPWGRKRSRLFVEIVDEDLLLLKATGALQLEACECDGLTVEYSAESA